MSSFDILRIRQTLGRKVWGPPHPYGDGGWHLDRYDRTGRILLSLAAYEERDGVCRDWIHASMSRRLTVPSYEELKLLHRAVFGDRWAYQVFAPAADHISDHDWCLHLWGRADGTPLLPNFVVLGSI